MNILMVNLPYSGHTNPALGLAKELVSRGHHVGFINSADWKQRVETTGAEFIPYDNYPTHPSVNQEKKLCFYAAYDTALAKGKDYDVIIYELLFYLGDKLAKELNKPAIRQFSMFAWNKEVLDTFIKKCPLWSALKSVSLKKCLTKITSHGIEIQQKDMLDEILYQIPKLNIVYTSREFQIDQKNFDQRFQFVGPSIYQRLQDMEILYEKMKKPIIYISLGTVLNFNILFLRKCITAFKGQEVSVIISAGKFAGILKKHCKAQNISIYQSVPQLQVLEHADLFITHGGMNSVDEAIYYGVPMIVAPMGSDQPTVADRVKELGMGKRIKSVFITSKKIRSEASCILKDANLKSNIRVQSEYMHKAGGLKKAADLVESFLNNNS